jgi:hypothetical protein
MHHKFDRCDPAVQLTLAGLDKSAAGAVLEQDPMISRLISSIASIAFSTASRKTSPMRGAPVLALSPRETMFPNALSRVSRKNLS